MKGRLIRCQSKNEKLVVVVFLPNYCRRFVMSYEIPMLLSLSITYQKNRAVDF